jgi:hypothetical protein
MEDAITTFLNTSIDFGRARFAFPIYDVQDLQGHYCSQCAMRIAAKLILQAISFADLLRTQYLLRSPTGRLTE